MIDPDTNSAFHEAGHATVGLALGVRIREVSIVGQGEGGGECCYDAPHGIAPAVRLRTAVAGSLGTLGLVARFRFLVTADDDRQRAMEALERLHGPPPWPGSEPHAGELRRAVADARRILEHEVVFHRDLASRLRRAGRLDGATVHRLWGDRWRPVGAAGW